MPVVVHRQKKELGMQNLLLTSVSLETIRGKTVLIDFSVSQLLELEETHAVIRFDCSHGFLNVHRYYRGKNDRTDYADQKPTTELYQECKKDILQNWANYFRLFIQNRLNG